MQSALLIGNGLNRCYKDSIPWDKLLERVAQKYNVRFNRNNPFPLEFESIANQILNSDKRNADEVYSEIKSSIASMVSSQEPNRGSLQELFTATIPAYHILTTNYDDMLEKAYMAYAKAKPSECDKSEKKYSLHRFEKCGDKTFYHIHGEAAKEKSLCLGYEHYAAYLAEMRKYLRASPAVSDRVLETSLPDKRSWVDLFFTHDIYILALTLDTNEIDLWWLLTYRAFLYYSNDAGLKSIMKNRVKIFLTDDGTKREKLLYKQGLFHNLHVETELVSVHDGNYEEAYKIIAQKIRQGISVRE